MIFMHEMCAHSLISHTTAWENGDLFQCSWTSEYYEFEGNFDGKRNKEGRKKKKKKKSENEIAFAREKREIFFVW